MFTILSPSPGLLKTAVWMILNKKGFPLDLHYEMSDTYLISEFEDATLTTLYPHTI